MSRGFFVMFHYPNQVLRPMMFSQHKWETPTEKGRKYRMVFTVENVEIFKRRKKCKDYVNYDEEVMDTFIQKVGCKPTYYLPRNDVPVCNTTKTMKEMASNIVLGKDPGIDPPCKSLGFMTFKYSEGTWQTGTDTDRNAARTGRNTGFFWLNVQVPNLIFKVSHSL